MWKTEAKYAGMFRWHTIYTVLHNKCSAFLTNMKCQQISKLYSIYMNDNATLNGNNLHQVLHALMYKKICFVLLPAEWWRYSSMSTTNAPASFRVFSNRTLFWMKHRQNRNIKIKYSTSMRFKFKYITKCNQILFLSGRFDKIHKPLKYIRVKLKLPHKYALLFWPMLYIQIHRQLLLLPVTYASS